MPSVYDAFHNAYQYPNQPLPGAFTPRPAAGGGPAFDKFGNRVGGWGMSPEQLQMLQAQQQTPGYTAMPGTASNVAQMLSQPVQEPQLQNAPDTSGMLDILEDIKQPGAGYTSQHLKKEGKAGGLGKGELGNLGGMLAGLLGGGQTAETPDVDLPDTASASTDTSTSTPSTGGGESTSVGYSGPAVDSQQAIAEIQTMLANDPSPYADQSKMTRFLMGAGLAKANPVQAWQAWTQAAERFETQRGLKALPILMKAYEGKNLGDASNLRQLYSDLIATGHPMLSKMGIDGMTKLAAAEINMRKTMQMNRSGINEEVDRLKKYILTLRDPKATAQEKEDAQAGIDAHNMARPGLSIQQLRGQNALDVVGVTGADKIRDDVVRTPEEKARDLQTREQDIERRKQGIIDARRDQAAGRPNQQGGRPFADQLAATLLRIPTESGRRNYFNNPKVQKWMKDNGISNYTYEDITRILSGQQGK